MSSIKVIEVQDYVPFSIDLLPVGKRVPFEVFILEDGQIKQVLNRGNIFTRLLKDTLQEKNIKTLYIHVNERKFFNKFIDENKPLDYFDKILERFIVNNEKYFKIDKNCIVSEIPVNFAIHVYDGKNLSLWINASEANSIKIDSENFPDGDLLISKKDLVLYQEYLERVLKENKGNEYVLKEKAKIMIRELYENPESRKVLKILMEQIDSLIELISTDKDFILKLTDLKKHDNYTYIHSLNVMTLSVGLGIKIGLDREALNELAISSILHDIGKTKISPLILAKLGRLTDKEFEIYKTHVNYSVEISKQFNLSEVIISGIAHHHEKLNGKGYPMRLKGDEISLFGKIIAIVDAFDMMTTPKPLKYPLTPFNSLQILIQDKGCFDKEILSIFIKMLGRII